MPVLSNAYPLYNFLKYCSDSALKRVVLDCGAGGDNPPLALFYEHGYRTYGIEISPEQLEKAEKFSQAREMNLNVIEGDMTEIPFDSDFFSFLFSYNTSVHMKKKDFLQALAEFERVLKVGGLCYVNFLSKECATYGKGISLGPGEYSQDEGGQAVLYCHYGDKEVEKSLRGFDIIYKEKRLVERKVSGKVYQSGFLDYILQKKE